MPEFAPFTGTPAEFQASLGVAAREIYGRVRTVDERSWAVTSGTWLCTNSNAIPWELRVALKEDGSWTVDPVVSALPWTRKRVTAVAEHRKKQLTDLLRTPREFGKHERDPFHGGPGLAGGVRTFCRATLESAVSMLLVLVVTTLACVFVIDSEIGKIIARSEVLTRVHIVSLPNSGEVDSLGFAGRLAAAFLLGVPIAFFLGIVHAGIHFVGKASVGVSQLAPWTSAFMFGMALMGFLPRMSPGVAMLSALAIPLVANLGTTLVWGRFSDAIKESAPSWRIGPAVVVALVVLVGVGFVLVPTPKDNDDRVEATANFRDRFLLNHAAGRMFARFYYRYTLFAAEPVKAIFADDPAKPGKPGYDHQLRTALVIGDISNEAIHLKETRFVAEQVPDAKAAQAAIEKRQHDIYIVAPTMTLPLRHLQENGLLHRTISLGTKMGPTPPGYVTVTLPASPETWQKAIFEVSRLTWLEEQLQVMVGSGWSMVYYVGPLFILSLILAPFAALLVWLYGRYPVRVGHLTIAAIFLLSSGTIVALFLGSAGSATKIFQIRACHDDQLASLETLEKGLADESAEVRYEAVYRVFLNLKRSTFPRARFVEPLLRTVQDQDVRVRLWSAPALGLTRDERVRDAIHQALEDPQIFVRYRAAEGLGFLDDEAGRGLRKPSTASINLLVGMMKTGRWYEGMYALQALRRIVPSTF